MRLQGVVKKLGLTEAERRQLREANAAYWERPGARERFSRMMSERWRDPEFRRAHRAAILRRSDPEVRRNYSEAARRGWQKRRRRA